jgi:hypothetical protein
MKLFLAVIGCLVAANPPLFAISPKLKTQGTRQDYLLKISDGDVPNTQVATQNVGNIWMTITNIGQFGTGYLGSAVDPITGLASPSCIFPAGSNINYLYVGAFWIGAVVGRDTLVSIGVDDYYSVIEFWPDPAPRGEIQRRSIQPSNMFYSEDAVSEQDIIAVYTDTTTNSNYVATDFKDGRPHIPLGIEVTQRSYAWSYDYAQNFILFDYSIANIGRRNLNKVYMGIYVDGDVHHTSKFGSEGYGDDLCGFLKTFPAGVGCDFVDTVNIAYIMDNDGDPEGGVNFSSLSARGAAGVRVVRTPSDSLRYSFNWWATDYNAANDFGPRRQSVEGDPFRDMDGLLGTPLGDRNKYYVMRHEEFDYDQLFVGKDHTADGWLPRPHFAADIADGFDARYLLSFGPFDISPGEVLPLSFAWVCSDNLHTAPENFKRRFNLHNPEILYNTFDFSGFASASKWASWIYDNPNVDTDGDGYKGKYRICCADSQMTVDSSVLPPETTFVCLYADTNYYEGDGVPDFRGASPPPPPVVRVYPRINENNSGELIVRWNGYESELAKDVFSGRHDFEGYRVYQSLSPNIQNFVLLASYDKEDYNRWIWNGVYERWILVDPPFTLDSLRRLYGENFDPLDHTIDYPLRIPGVGGAPDSTFYFSRQDWNSSNLDDQYAIHKRFPDADYPSTLDLDSAKIYFPEELTEDTLFKYFEYEYIIRNLLPSQLYYISVTAFDYGSPGHGLEAMETKPTLNMVAAYAQNSPDIVLERNLPVVVYPNPYRIDGAYRSTEGGGFEGRGQEDLPADRVRAIHFANVPPRCTIRIFSIDGDLVREIKHDVSPDSPQSSHAIWDLITRNTQETAPGIYYYSVESEYGNQIGKLVIIK